MGKTFKDQDDDDLFVCEDCGEEFPIEEMRGQSFHLCENCADGDNNIEDDLVASDEA
jgi:hypothetical protein